MTRDRSTFRFLPLTLSVETLGGLAVSLVRRGTPLPAKRSQKFSTTRDNQKTVTIQVYFGESPIAEKNIPVAKVDLTEIPDGKRGEPEIVVTFEVSEECKISISAIEKGTGKKVAFQVDDTSPHLTDEKVADLLAKAESTQNEDKALAEQIEVRNKGTDLANRAEKYLQKQQEYGLQSSVEKEIEEILATLGISLGKDDIPAIREKSKRLKSLLPNATFDTLGDIFGGDIFGGIFATPPKKKDASQKPAQRNGKTLKKTSELKEATSTPKTEELAKSDKGLFYAGQQFDAKLLVRDIFYAAKTEIVIIDPYVGEDVLNLLTVKNGNVDVKVLTGKVSPPFLTLAKDFNRQYGKIQLRSSEAFHDRFIIIDQKEFYHFGASLEHLGKKTFMFSKLEEPTIISALKKQWDQEWTTATQKL